MISLCWLVVSTSYVAMLYSNLQLDVFLLLDAF
jgi:hypothetical protein